MHGVILLTMLAVPGVEYGWKETSQGREYIIQIEPHYVRELSEGKEVYSDVPKEKSAIDRLRLHHGSGQPREEELTSQQGLPGVRYGYEYLPDGGINFIAQIPLASVPAFQQGQDALIAIPQTILSVQRFTVRIGNDPLPQGATPPAPIAAGAGGVGAGGIGAGGVGALGGAGNTAGAGTVMTAPAPPVIDLIGPSRASTRPVAAAPNLTPVSPYGNNQQQQPAAQGYAGGQGYPGQGGQGAVGSTVNNQGNYNAQPPTSYPYGMERQFPQPYDGRTGTQNYAASQPPLLTNFSNAGQATGSQGYYPQQQPSYQSPAGLGTTVASAAAPGANPVTDPAPTRVSSPPNTTPTTVANTELPPRAAARDESAGQIALMLVLIASLGGNMYLAWVAHGFYDRYRRAMSDMRDQSRRAARA
ncbi:MAG: hypothetical protein KDB14_33705 [Planctomycetales bacterium]|nr:hypothetical protein [Planctomycetales bacterium]